MACRRVGAKPLCEHYAGILFIGSLERQWNFNWNFNIFIQENAFENVICEKVAFFVLAPMSQPQKRIPQNMHTDDWENTLYTVSRWFLHEKSLQIN